MDIALEKEEEEEQLKCQSWIEFFFGSVYTLVGVCFWFGLIFQLLFHGVA